MAGSIGRGGRLLFSTWRLLGYEGITKVNLSRPIPSWGIVAQLPGVILEALVGHIYHGTSCHCDFQFHATRKCGLMSGTFKLVLSFLAY